MQCRLFAEAMTKGLFAQNRILFTLTLQHNEIHYGDSFMRKFISLALLIFCLALMIVPVSAQSDMFTLTANVANLRTGHGIEYPVIGQIFRGSVFPIMAYSPTANWAQLDLGGGRSGWVFVHLGEIAYAGVNTPIVTTTNAGQGGGSPTPATGGSVVNAPTTAQATNLGQGGGFPAPTSNSQVVGTMTIQEFNSTVGVIASANMRRGPGLGFGIVWIIPVGNRATPLARNANGTWILVNFEGHEGWVYFELIAAPPAIDLTALPIR
jgi:N-acetylmuramoyl-L-alanine amidase